MENPRIGNVLSGRAIGSMFFSIFGAGWLMVAFYARQTLTLDTAICVASLLGALLFTSVWLLKQARRWPKTAEDPKRSRSFNRINAVQWIAVAVVAFSFSRLHLDAYVISAITAIVGVHMFPLAKLFRYSMHNVTGAALVLWASATVLVVPAEHLQGITAMGTGIILILSAAMAQAIAIRIALRAGITQHTGPKSLCI